MTVSFDRAALVLIFAAIVDYLIGDPRGWLHPVQVMGWLIFYMTELTLKFCQQKWLRRFVGICLGIGLIAGSGAIA
ncbi:MAG: cobalamin biosynthesis protein, partial [Xenococcaceae cyanobacterium]